MIKYFPVLKSYNFGVTGGIKDIKNIFKSVNINIDDTTNLKVEKINAGERPEQLSYRLYGNFNYYWLLMLLNGIKNPFRWNTILGQNIGSKELDFYNTRILQFSNSSPFLPTEAESGFTYGGLKYNLYPTTDIDQYDAVDFDGIQIGDIAIFETGLGSYGIKCAGTGIIKRSDVLDIFEAQQKIDHVYHYGQSIIPDNLTKSKSIKQITATEKFSCALSDTGYIYCWGDPSVLSNFDDFLWVGELFSSIQGGFTYIEASNNKLVGIRSTNENSTLRFWSVESTESLPQKIAYDSNPKPALKTSWYKGFDNGLTGGLVLTTGHTLAAYGISGIPTGTTFIDISCGNDFCVGIMGNGGITAWGSNTYNQKTVPSGTGFTKVVAGYNHALALKNDGTVYAWGATASGQCVVPNKLYTDISAGKKHSAALTTNNELVAWGQITKAGFTGSQITGITQSNYTLNQYSIYGLFDQIYSGNDHIVLRGLSGSVKKFVGIITDIDAVYKRLVCKIYGGDLGEDELFFDDPTGTNVSFWRGTVELKTIQHKLLGIQKQKNAVIQIESGGEILSMDKEIWKQIYIQNYNIPENDNRLITLQKLFDMYNTQLKQDFYYGSTNLLQKIDSAISSDLATSKTSFVYNISSF